MAKPTTTRSFSPQLYCRVFTNLHKFSVYATCALSRFLHPHLYSPSLTLSPSLYLLAFFLSSLSLSLGDHVQKTSHEQVITFLRSLGEVFFFFGSNYCIPNDITDRRRGAWCRRGRQDRLADMSSPLNTTSTPVGKQTTRKNPNDVSIYTGEIKE